MKARRRTSARSRLPEATLAEPEGLGAWAARYLEALRVRNYSERTVETRAPALGAFVRWCEERSILRPADVTRPIVERYARHLYHHRKSNGQPLSFGSQSTRLAAVKGYFKWLARQNVLLWNPASELELPRPERRLPRFVLTVAETERVLALPDVTTALGLRDRAILETLYSTGIRRMELIHLRLYDLDVERKTLRIDQGKGKKDRVVPIGERAVRWIEKYLADARPKLAVDPAVDTLFLNQHGEPIHPEHLTSHVGDYVAAAELGKRGSCHLFRHTMATLMLEHGADVRYVQEMLGHAKLETTEIYTHVSIRKLQEVHARTHPAAKLAPRRASGGEPAGDDAGSVDARAELLATLGAEADDEDGEP
jgi:integrase/recombinase XerD